MRSSATLSPCWLLGKDHTVEERFQHRPHAGLDQCPPRGIETHLPWVATFVNGSNRANLAGHAKLSPTEISHMDTSDPSNDLGPLPQVDRNAELEELSITALSNALPVALFRLRDERGKDTGVDASVEVLLEGRATHFRAYIQMKATEKGEKQRDGHIVVPIAPSNLNYLLNGPSPLYILYVVARDELYFLWAHEEAKRLDDQVPGWRKQQQVRLKFRDRLTAAALNNIHQRVMLEGRLYRKSLEILQRSTGSDQVTISVNPETLACVDPQKVERLLLSSGMALVSFGLAASVLDHLDTLSPSITRTPRLRLVSAYAQYSLGRPQGALAYIAEALLGHEKLTTDEMQQLRFLKTASEYQLGRLTQAEFIARQEEWGKSADGEIGRAWKLMQLYHEHMDEEDDIVRRQRLEAFQQFVHEVQARGNTSHPFRLHARLMLLYAEAMQAVCDIGDGICQLKLLACYGQMIDLDNWIRNVQDKIEPYERECSDAMEEAKRQNNPLLLGDALATRAAFRVAYLATLTIANGDFDFDLPYEARFPAMLDAEQAQKVYASAKQIEGKLRAKLLLADLFELGGQSEAAQVLAAGVLPVAEAMDYSDLRAKARAHLENNTIMKVYISRRRRLATEDEDVILCEASDQLIRQGAGLMARGLSLPGERIDAAERDWFSLRDIAYERLYWCQYIGLLQDLTHTMRPETHYKTDPKRKCDCTKLGVRSAEGHTDWKKVISEFKEIRCAKCPHRLPKVS